MAISRTQDYVPTTLKAGVLATAIRTAFESLGLEPPSQFSVTEHLKDGSQSDQTLDVAGLDRFCDLTDRNLSVRASGGPSGPQTWHYLAVNGGREGAASVHVQAPDGSRAEALIDSFLTSAGLARYEAPPPDPVVEGSSPTAEDVRSPAQGESRVRLRAFLSFRFGAGDNNTVAQYVERLLTLLDVDVITGRGYEPRALGAKVADRLAGIDLVVLLIGADGESAWTRDEIATARATGTPVVPLVASGSKFEPGIFGDLEYIPFEIAHPGDVSVALIEAIQYVHRTRDIRAR
jgi:hypothetical protein